MLHPSSVMIMVWMEKGEKHHPNQDRRLYTHEKYYFALMKLTHTSARLKEKKSEFSLILSIYKQKEKERKKEKVSENVLFSSFHWQ